jgi:hypothetical protein
MAPAVRPWTVSVLLILLTQTFAIDATIQRFKELPSLYYDHVSEAQLYNTEWRILKYINLQEADHNLGTVKKYANHPWSFVKTMRTHVGLILQIARKLLIT